MTSLFGLICTGIVIGVIHRGNTVNSEHYTVSAPPMSDISQKLRSLTQLDLIEYSVGRVWYLRSVNGDNLEFVGWIGDNTKVEEISSLVPNGDHFRIVRQSDPAWPAARDKYFRQ